MSDTGETFKFMTSNRFMVRLGRGMLSALCPLMLLCASLPLLGDDSIHLVPGSLPRNAAEQLPAFSIDVRDAGATPPRVRAKAGRLLLVVTNTAVTMQADGLVVDPGSAGDGTVSASPVLRLGSSAVNDEHGRSAGIIDALAGELDLDAYTGKILTRILF